MNTEQLQNLRNLSRANRESTAKLNMHAYAAVADRHVCNTAYCNLGNYVAREDLQSVFAFSVIPIKLGPHIAEIVYKQTEDSDALMYDGVEICNHFGITYEEAYELFAPYCKEGVAKYCNSPQQVADYIDRFIERKLAQEKQP